MTGTTRRKPRGLKTAGTRLWETVTAEFDVDDEPAKTEFLSQACRVSDTIAQLERAAAKAPMIVLGSARQQTINPLISEVRYRRGLFAQLLGRLGLPDTDTEAAEKAAKAGVDAPQGGEVGAVEGGRQVTIRRNANRRRSLAEVMTELGIPPSVWFEVLLGAPSSMT